MLVSRHSAVTMYLSLGNGGYVDRLCAEAITTDKEVLSGGQESKLDERGGHITRLGAETEPQGTPATASRPTTDALIEPKA